MNQEQQSDSKSTKLDTLSIFISALGIILSCGHLFLAIYPWLSELERNIFHFAGFALMCVLIYPIWGDRERSSHSALIVDIIIGILVTWAVIHLAFAEDWIYERGVRLSTLDWIASIPEINLSGPPNIPRTASRRATQEIT